MTTTPLVTPTQRQPELTGQTAVVIGGSPASGWKRPGGRLRNGWVLDPANNLVEVVQQRG